MAMAPPLDEMMLVRALVPRAVESTVVIGSSACQASGSELGYRVYIYASTIRIATRRNKQSESASAFQS